MYSFSSWFQKWSSFCSETNRQLAQCARRQAFLLAFFGLMGFGSLFQSSDMKLQIKYNFRLKKFCPKTVLSNFFLRKTRKKGKTLNSKSKLSAFPKQEKRPFFESAWKTPSIKDGVKETLGNWPTLTYVLCRRKGHKGRLRENRHWCCETYVYVTNVLEL